MSRPRLLSRALLILCLLGPVLPTAQAATALSFAPISIRLVGNQRTALLTVRNVSTQTSSFNLELMSWTQSGEDQYAPTRDLIMNPTGFTLKPGQEQTIRFALRGAPDAKAEHAYRVFVQELPPVAKEGPEGSVQVNTLYRLSLPLMTFPTDAKAQLAFALERSSNGLNLVVRNTGNRYATLTDVEVNVDGQQVDVPAFNVLGGGLLSLPIEGALPNTTSIALRFVQNQQPQSLTLKTP